MIYVPILDDAYWKKWDEDTYQYFQKLRWHWLNNDAPIAFTSACHTCRGIDWQNHLLNLFVILTHSTFQINMLDCKVTKVTKTGKRTVGQFRPILSKKLRPNLSYHLGPLAWYGGLNIYICKSESTSLIGHFGQLS